MSPRSLSGSCYLAGAAEEREVIHAELLKHFERDTTGESYATWNLEDVIDWLEERMEPECLSCGSRHGPGDARACAIMGAARKGAGA